MALFTESWTGSNGAAWPAAWTVTTPTGGTTDIQSNAGRQITGTTASQGPFGRYNLAAAVTDLDLYVTVTLTAASQYSLIAYRTDAVVANRATPNNGYAVYLDGGLVLALFGCAGGSPANLGSVALGVASVTIRFRVLVIGTRHRIKAWDPANPEPDTWDLDIIDATFASGVVGVGVEDTTATPSAVTWDNFSLTYPPGAFLSPTSDVTVNSWTTDSGGTTGLYQAIDEGAPSDVDYVQSPEGAFTSSYYECGLQSQAGDAGLSTGHVASYRYQASAGSGSDVTVSLRQGSSTEIAAWTHNNIGTSWATVDQTLTGTQADNITYPTDLRIKFEPNADGPATPALVASSTGSVSNLTGQASTALTVTSGMAGAIQVGHYMIAWVAVDNSGASGARPGLTVTDSRSNAWTVTTGALQDPGAASAGAACYIAYARITTAYQTSDTITFNWTVGGTSTAGKSISVSAFSGIASTSPVAVAEVANQGAGTAFTISITPTAADQLVVVAGAIEGASGDTWTNDADTTNGSWTALTEVSTGNTGVGDMTLQGAYKVVTASGAQTWNSTITSRDWAANAIAFAPQPAARVQVSWAGLTIPFAAPPPTDRPSARIIYQPAVQRAALW